VKRYLFIGLTMLFCGAAGTAAGQGSVVHWRATLFGTNEVPPIATPGTGTFDATIDKSGGISFTLTFDGLRAPAVVSHIHFAPTDVAGGVMIFLCGGGGQPACPAATSGTVEGTITAANVVGPVSQGIAPGELDEALQAIAQGEGYVNIHDAVFPAGEIRGQVRVPGAENDKK
jgi:CHRD domain-containing protein